MEVIKGPPPPALVLWSISHAIYICLPLIVQSKLSLSLGNKDEWSHSGRTRAITNSQGNKNEQQDECTGSKHNKERRQRARTIASAMQPGPLCINAQQASEGELEISLYLRQNRLSSQLETNRSTGERRLDVIGRGHSAFAASHPRLSSLLKE